LHFRIPSAKILNQLNAMSITSYKRNVALGVTGPEIGTCLPSALDQLTKYRGVKTETYRLYPDIVDAALAYNGHDKRDRNPLYRYIYARIATELGADYDDCLFLRLRTRRGFVNSIGRLVEQGWRVSVDVVTEECIPNPDGFVHSVGLKPAPGGQSDGVKLVSNWVPDHMQGELSLGELFGYVYQPYACERASARFPFNDAHLIALPPQRQPK
jgi:hypothetical protein